MPRPRAHVHAACASLVLVLNPWPGCTTASSLASCSMLCCSQCAACVWCASKKQSIQARLSLFSFLHFIEILITVYPWHAYYRHDWPGAKRHEPARPPGLRAKPAKRQASSVKRQARQEAPSQAPRRSEERPTASARLYGHVGNMRAAAGCGVAAAPAPEHTRRDAAHTAGHPQSPQQQRPVASGRRSLGSGEEKGRRRQG